MSKKTPNPTDQYIGGKIRTRRLARGLSQTNLGDALGLTFQQIQKYENGTNRVSGGRLSEMAKALSCDVSYFFEGLPVTFEKGAVLDYVQEFLIAPEAHALMRSFMAIKDSRVRQALVTLCRSTADVFATKDAA